MILDCFSFAFTYINIYIHFLYFGFISHHPTIRYIHSRSVCDDQSVDRKPDCTIINGLSSQSYASNKTCFILHSILFWLVVAVARPSICCCYCCCNCGFLLLTCFPLNFYSGILTRMKCVSLSMLI